MSSVTVARRAARGGQATSQRLLASAQVFHSLNAPSRSLSSSSSSSSPLSRPLVPRSVGYPLLAVSVSLLAAQQLHFHSSPLSSEPAAAATPATSPATPTSSPTPPPSPPSFDLTVLPYYSKAAFLSQATVKLYQFQTCPFCNKVRAYLDYMRIPYEVVEVNPLTKTQLQPLFQKAVPVVTVDHLVLHDSSPIISAFDDLFTHYTHKAASTHPPSTPSPSPSTPTRADETRWREWVDRSLIYLTAPNLYTSLPASLQAMDYIMAQTSLPLSQRLASKYVGGPMMYLVTEYKLKKKRGVTDARGQLFGACKEFVDEGVAGRWYRGGEKPDLSDLAVFGVVRAMMGFPVGEELMQAKNVGEGFVQWYQRMEREVGSSSAKNASGAAVGPEYRRGEVASQ